MSFHTQAQRGHDHARRRVDSRVIMDQLGHSDPRMVGRYQHVVDDLREGAADAVEAMWWPPTPSETPSTEGPRTGEVPNPGS